MPLIAAEEQRDEDLHMERAHVHHTGVTPDLDAVAELVKRELAVDKRLFVA